MTTVNQQNTNYISEAMATSLPGLFAMRVKNSPEKLAYQQYVDGSSAWQDYSWNDIHQRVCRWRHALEQENLTRGDRIAIVLGNCIEWVCFDQAAQSLGLVVVSLYTTDTTENIAYILGDAGVRLLLVDAPQTWSGIAERGQSLDALQRVWCLTHNEQFSSSHEQFRYVDDVLPETAPSYTNQETDPDALATIIYTSGTTGRPKGVMLSHHNILSNAEAVQKKIPAYEDDIFLSFLPLAHGFERTVEYILPMMAGSRVTYARSISLLRDDLVLVRPTIFISAPRLYEKIYAAIQEKISTSWLKQKLFDWTVSLGWKQFLAGQKRGPRLNPVQQFFLTMLKALVSKKVLTKLGGRIRIAVTGAAPLSPTVSRFFVGLGLPLLEGYGLTEAGPVVSANNLADNVPGSVGRSLPGIEVTIAADNELLVRSPGVMQGYWQREQATQEVIDKDGWLHTGDLAEIKDHHIYIKGRSKEILVTSTGEKVAPADMETTILLNPLFEQAMVVGEGKPYISALVILNENAWFKLAGKLGLDPADKQSLHSEKATNAILERLTTLLNIFPGYAQIRAVHLSCEAWTIENGLLTPTMKIKRHVLEERFTDEIRELYRGHVMIE